MWFTKFKQAFKYILNQKKYSLVIIIGLSTAMACSFLLYSYIFYECHFDDFHQKRDKVYRVVVTHQAEGRDPYKSPYSYAPQGPVAKDEIPEVEGYLRLMNWSSIVITAEERNQKTILTERDYYYADENFFELFTFPLLRGDRKTVLKEPGTVVISHSLASKLYGSQNPVGKTIRVDGKYNNRITGVFEDIPDATHLKFNLLFSLNTFPWIMNKENAWENHSFFTYLLLKEGADPKEVGEKLTKAYRNKNRAVHQMECTWELQAVDEAYLNTSDFTSKPDAFKYGDERMVYFLSIIAVLILCIAWVNYINLNTAKLAERAKEISVRRTNGANNRNLIAQFFAETMLFNLISLLIAIGIVGSLFNWFQSTMSFSFSHWNNVGFWIVIGFCFILGIALPGCISAVLATRSNFFQSLSKKSRAGLGFSYRNALVVLQFVIIIALMVSVVLINKQLNYLHTVDLGFQKEQVLVVNAPRVDVDANDNGKLLSFRETLMRQSDIVDLTASASIPGERFGNGNGGPHIVGTTNDDTYFRVGRVLSNYLDFYGIQLVAGRGFLKGAKADDKAIVINEKAVKEFGFQNAEDAIQRQAMWQGREVTIVGVTRDFHQQSLHIEPEPMILYTMPYETDINYLLVKLNPENLEQTIRSIQKQYQAFFPDNPFDYFFLDRFFDQQYRKDIQFQKLFSFFSIVAFLIGLFGLYGLTTFRIGKRTKEIGVRKVNGAKTLEIMALLNRDFIKWVAIAFVIACPLAWYAMRNWLENFAYRTEMDWWIFALAGIIAIGVALLTVSLQTWRAATRNPVESLRYE